MSMRVMATRSEMWLRGLVLTVCALFAGAAFSQDQGPIHPTPQSVPPQKNVSKGIQLDVNLALVNVTVTDPLNRLVTGLEKENFRVFEDGTEQEVVNLSSEDVPISIGLIFD